MSGCHGNERTTPEIFQLDFGFHVADDMLHAFAICIYFNSI